MPAFPLIEYQEKEIRWINQEDQIKIFRLVPDADKPLVAFMMLHGVRPGEARALRCKEYQKKGK